jgi:hypothetical protein
LFPLAATPDFAEVYTFIGDVFDNPDSDGYLPKLKGMAPIDRETVLLLMQNLSINLACTPGFVEEPRQFSEMPPPEIRRMGADHSMSMSVPSASQPTLVRFQTYEIELCWGTRRCCV